MAELELVEPSTEELKPVTFSDVLEQSWFATYLTTFIATSDIFNYAACCRGTRVVRLLRPNPRHEMARSWDNPPSQYAAHEWQPLDLVGVGKLPRGHSVIVKCEWKDQGWGNRKGMLSVVKDDGKAPNDYQPWSEAVVCGKEPAPHEWQELKLSFRVDHRDGGDGVGDCPKYRLCARAGGGGGHSLQVRNLVVREILIIDGPEALQAFHGKRDDFFALPWNRGNRT